MKPLPLRQVLLLCLPILVIAIVAIMRTQAREKLKVYHSYPFTPRMNVVAEKGLSDGTSRNFRIDANLFSIGGRGQSRWLVRGQWFDVSSKRAREVWNSQTKAGSSKIQNTARGSYSTSLQEAENPARPTYQTNFVWHFSLQGVSDKKFKYVVEAVAVPFSQADEIELGTTSITVAEATAVELAAARQRSGAQFFRKTLIMDAKDDRKHWSS